VYLRETVSAGEGDPAQRETASSAQWYWLKAEELRVDAENIRDPIFRRQLLDIAHS